MKVDLSRTVKVTVRNFGDVVRRVEFQSIVSGGVDVLELARALDTTSDRVRFIGVDTDHEGVMHVTVRLLD